MKLSIRNQIRSRFIRLVGLRKDLQYLLYGPKRKWSTKRLSKFVLSEYKHSHGYKFDMQHPTLFTEKVCWYKVFYRNPELKNIVDKVAFKRFVAGKLGEGYTIPMYGAWSCLEDLVKDWAKLPEEFVLKSNCSSAGDKIKVVHHKSELNFDLLKKELKNWFDPRRTLIEGDAVGYFDLVPMVLAEEYKSNVGNQLYDYKFFCFDGKPTYVYVAQDHFGPDGSHISFYDLNWIKLDVQYGDHIIGEAPCPAHFEQMKELALKLSAGFPFVRVDFFDTGDELFLAEMTFYPGGGFTPYKPKSFNEHMGDLFVLPKKI